MDSTTIEMYARIITLNILNKTREYHGRDTRESEDFVSELEEDTKKYLLKATNQ